MKHKYKTLKSENNATYWTVINMIEWKKKRIPKMKAPEDFEGW